MESQEIHPGHDSEIEGHSSLRWAGLSWSSGYEGYPMLFQAGRFQCSIQGHLLLRWASLCWCLIHEAIAGNEDAMNSAYEAQSLEISVPILGAVRFLHSSGRMPCVS